MCWLFVAFDLRTNRNISIFPASQGLTFIPQQYDKHVEHITQIYGDLFIY